jgi:Tol biopolymer transport system component
VIQIDDQERDIWVWNFARQTLTRLTFSPDLDYDPAWTPDGRRVVFSRAGSLFWRAADGTGVEERFSMCSLFRN